MPITRHMGVKVLNSSGETGIRLLAPLGPNLNHHQTAFGGSISALAILAGWALMFTRLQSASFEGQIIIQRNSVHYVKPITDDFEAHCLPPDDSVWTKFTDMLARKAKARIELRIEVLQAGVLAGVLTGVYVAMKATEGM